MAKMKAVVMHGFGGPDVLRVEEITRPEPGAGELLVRVVATSVNPIDYKARTGSIPEMFGEDQLPLVLGRDVSGRVEQVGKDVMDWKVGDAVFANTGLDRGSYAEFIVLKPEEAAAAPRTLPLADAGAIPLGALTSWQGRMRHGKLTRGQRVLIHAGAGGVGHCAVQFARVAGATVFATASGKDKAFLTELGADTAIDYQAERFEDVATDIDLVLDLVGGETQERSWSVLKPGGTIMSSVQQPDEGRARVVGALPGKWYIAEPSREDLTEIAALIDAAKVRLTISSRFTLDQIAEAQATLEKGGVRGKLLVTVSSDT